VDFTITLLRLVLAHIVGDFVLQPKRWITERRAQHWRSPRLYVHGILHGVLAYVALGAGDRWREAALIAVTHVGIDVLKSYKDGHGHSARWFVVDQALHALVIAWIAAEVSGVHVGSWMRDLVTRPTSIFIRTFTSRWDNELVNRKDNLPGAGNWIGLIERTLIVLFVVTDHFDAVGFLLAAKSVFRFGDLTNKDERKRTEYVLIGTLLSFAIAIVVGLAARAVVVG